MFNVGYVQAYALKDYLNGKLTEPGASQGFEGDPFAGEFVSFVVNPHSGVYTVVSKEA